MFKGTGTVDDIPDEVVQIVDTQCVVRLLRGRQTLESYLNALNQGKRIGNGSVVGVYFEECLHQWFCKTPPRQVEKVVKSGGTAEEGVRQLRDKNVYWIPSIPNFPNIDAAVVTGDVLYAFQYTTQSSHDFKNDTFWKDFVHVVRGQVEFAKVHVYIVLIKGVSSALKVNFTEQFTIIKGTRESAEMIDISCTSSTLNIDTANVQSMCTSAEEGFLFDH